MPELRPRYESDRDLENEREICDVLMRAWGLTSCEKLSISYGLDYALRRDVRVVGFAEIKARDIPINMPGGYYVGAQKARSAHILSESVHIPATLVIRCRGGEVGYWNFAGDAEPGAIWAGRKDRGDRFDMEPHVVFPWTRFKRIA